jgi:hypothetical protein
MCKGGSLLDCARAWNTRAQRMIELTKHDRGILSLLYSDICIPSEKMEYTYLDNTDPMWKIARGAECAWDDNYSSERPDIDYIKIRTETLRGYLTALMDEVANRY